MSENYIVVSCTSCNNNYGKIFIYNGKFDRKFVLNGESRKNRIGDKIALQKDELADATRLWYTRGTNITYANLVEYDGALNLEETEYG